MTIRGRSTAHSRTGWRIVSPTTRGAEHTYRMADGEQELFELDKLGFPVR
jgi:hypothetical protein